jgi:hypothetical protein
MRVQEIWNLMCHWTHHIALNEVWSAITYIYCMLLREIWKFIHPKVSYFPRATPTWSHRTQIIFREINIIFHPFGSLTGFPDRVIVLWQENVRGTRNASHLMKIYSPKSIIFPEGNARGEYDNRGWINSIFPEPACNKCILLYLIY